MSNRFFSSILKTFILLAGIMATADFWSACTHTVTEDKTEFSYKLDSALVGKFDSLRLQIYENNKLMETKVVAIKDTTKVIKVLLTNNPGKIFSVKVIGLKNGGIVYDKQFEYSGYKAIDSVGKDLKVLVKNISADTLRLNVGELKSPTVKILPDTASNKLFTLKVKINGILQVTGNQITALGAGQDSVQIISADGNANSFFQVFAKDDNLVTLTKIAVRDTSIYLGDTLKANLALIPNDASNRKMIFKNLNTSSLVSIANDTIVAKGFGVDTIQVTSAMDSSIHTTFKVTILVNFKKNVLPITTLKCFPCHTPSSLLNWQDSLAVLQYGINITDRITRPRGVANNGRMPVQSDQAINGDITDAEIAIVVKWISGRSIKVNSFFAPDTFAVLGDTIKPTFRWTPIDASNQNFILSFLNAADAQKVTVVGENDHLFAKKLGKTVIEATSKDGGVKSNFIFNIVLPTFNSQISPIVQYNCGRCHGPSTSKDYTDSATLMNNKSIILQRLGLVDTDPKFMPINAKLNKHDSLILQNFLNPKSIAFTGLNIADTSITVDDTLHPYIIWIPDSTSERTYTLSTADTALVTLIGGRLVGKKAGNATVTVAHGLVSKNFTVKVKPISFKETILPLMEAHCAACHSNSNNGFNATDSTSLLDKSRADIIKNRISKASGTPGIMPPQPQKRLDQKDINQIVQWIDFFFTP